MLQKFTSVQKQSFIRVLRKNCSANIGKFSGEHPRRSVISIIEITLLHVCSAVNFLPIFRTGFLKNNYGGHLLSRLVTSFGCIILFNRDLNSRCLVYLFSLRFSGIKFWEIYGGIFVYVNFSHNGNFVHKLLRDLQSFHFVLQITISKTFNLCSRLLLH